jgi:cytochrome d ubiquinol oxidase subunit I
MDVLLLSRLQFALTILFHYLFPPLTIGLSVVLVYLLWMRMRTGEAVYESAARFWTRIFGLNFALGVASGIVMEFQFGTNWAIYSRYVGDVFGSALAAEGIFAFFLESGFLAILLFGWDRVSPRFHFVSGLMVCLGSIFSSVWITVANSWQQTPAGHVLREHEINGQSFLRAEVTDFWALVFNPSTMHRLVHVWLGAFILGAFFVLSISSWYLLHGKHGQFARRSFRGALVIATVCSLAQMVSGDLQAKNVAEHQPAKLAAFEGLYQTRVGAGLYLFGWPDDHTRTVRAGVAVPGLLSWLIHGDSAAQVTGLDDLAPVWGQPPVWLSFQSYHAMVAIGGLFLVLTVYTSWLWWRGRLFDKRWLLWVFVFAVGFAFVANELGWVAAEVGRQPWIVYPVMENGQLTGGLRTGEGLSEVVRPGQVLGSILMFGLIYVLLFVLWIQILHRKIVEGPEPVAEEHAATSLSSFLATAARKIGKRRSMTGPTRRGGDGKPDGPGNEGGA